VGDSFPSMKARRLLTILCREPLGYTFTQDGTSHCKLRAADRPTIGFAFHDRATIPPGLVRRILVNQVGLTVEQAREVIK